MMWVVDLGYNLYIYTEASNRAYGYVVLRGLACDLEHVFS
jgi:hypothetical protein